MVGKGRPSHLILDANTESASCGDTIALVRKASPTTKIVLIRPAVRGYSSPPEREKRPDALLREPFTMMEFTQALYSSGFEHIDRHSVGRDVVS